MISRKILWSAGVVSAAVILAAAPSSARDLASDAAMANAARAIGNSGLQDSLGGTAQDAARSAARDAVIDGVQSAVSAPVTTADIEAHSVQAEPVATRAILSQTAANQQPVQQTVQQAATPVILPTTPSTAQQQYYLVRDANGTPVYTPVNTPQQGASRSIPASAHSAAGSSVPQVSGGRLPNGAQLVSFDRTAWLNECEARLATYDQNDQGRIIGALIGGLGGGLAGNRLDNGNRLGGSLLGAGVGTLAGTLIGDALDDRADQKARAAALSSAKQQCAQYLDAYMAQAQNAAPTTTFTPGQQYMLVPVTVPVAQQAVYREVTTTSGQ
jgi:outer membrane lipoprotein SlyB